MSETHMTRPDRLLLLNRDLMSGIAIANAARALGLTVERATTESELVERWRAVRATTALVVLDLNSPVAWQDIAELLAAAAGNPPVIGYGPHVDVEGRRTAKQAGLKRVFSNGEFHRTMGTAIARYAGLPAPDPAEC